MTIHSIKRLMALPLVLCSLTFAHAQTAEVAVPEGLETSYDSLLADWTAKHYLSIDNTGCTTIWQNPEFEPETYTQRLSRLPNIIPMPYNDVVRQFIDRYTVKMRKSMPLVLGASNLYTPFFEQALEEQGLPLELKYLPLVESCYNPIAVSRSGATGLWQFMLATARQYDLTVNTLIDERMDVVKASHAAARYLSDLYRIFNDWTLVVAAYNCGPENVNKAIRRAGGDNQDYWSIYRFLPAETQGYVPAFIAANYIMNYYCEHGICPAKATLPTATDTVVVNHDLRFSQIVAVCNVPEEQLRSLNPQYRRGIIPGESQPCALRLPPAAIGAFIDAGDSIYNYHNNELAQQRDPEAAQKPAAAAPAATKPASNVQRYTVRRGDTLGAIARKHHTTIDALRRLNGLKNDKLSIGQRLRVK